MIANQGAGMRPQPLPSYDDCFVCGRKNRLGLRLPFYREGNRVVTRFTLGPHHVGFKRIAHGGILATLMDEAMEWALVVQEQRFGLSTELTVRFLKPLKVGDRCTVSGWVTRVGRKVVETTGEVRDEEKSLLAQATGRYFLFSKEKSRHFDAYLTYADEAQRLFGTTGESKG